MENFVKFTSAVVLSGVIAVPIFVGNFDAQPHLDLQVENTAQATVLVVSASGANVPAHYPSLASIENKIRKIQMITDYIEEGQDSCGLCGGIIAPDEETSMVGSNLVHRKCLGREVGHGGVGETE
ncbi:MAG: hypothetical protein ACLQVM_01675 [Terriglobia bacterium]